MPHLTVEYSANLEGRTDLDALCAALLDTVLATGLFKVGAVRVRALRASGIIRRIGANFQSAKIGFKSTLCAASVPEDKFEAFAQAVNEHPGVTHNYLRAHGYNLWFTMIAPSREAIRQDLAAITEKTGVAILNLPADRLFKIRVDFAMSD